MIEKFTEEELEIIKRELKELPKDKAKRDYCEKEIERLHRAYPNEKVSGARHPYELTKTIFSIIDDFMGNFSKAIDNGRKYKSTYTRAIYIPKEFADEYRQCFGEIVDVLAKHAKKFEGENE